jgi:tRNA nucleotidyltransferase (CCA-adding enzyme)
MADIGVRGIGATPAQAFEQAAVALTAVITEPTLVQAMQRIEIDCEGPDEDLLLYDWLNALVYQMATRRMLFSRFELEYSEAKLHASVWGEPVDTARHQPAVEVKGATFTELAVGQGEDGCWHAQCVVDV